MNKKGFTLIELIIVMALLGALASIVLVALNPAQQLARARDVTRLSNVNSLGHSLELYATKSGGYYMGYNQSSAVPPKNWIVDYLVPNYIQAAPSLVTNSLTSWCVANQQNGYCYNASSATNDADRAIVYSKLESKAQISRCNTALDIQTGGIAWAMYSSVNSKSGIFCNNPSITSGESFDFYQAGGFPTCDNSHTNECFLP